MMRLTLRLQQFSDKSTLCRYPAVRYGGFYLRRRLSKVRGTVPAHSWPRSRTHTPEPPLFEPRLLVTPSLPSSLFVYCKRERLKTAAPHVFWDEAPEIRAANRVIGDRRVILA